MGNHMIKQVCSYQRSLPCISRAPLLHDPLRKQSMKNLSANCLLYGMHACPPHGQFERLTKFDSLQSLITLMCISRHVGRSHRIILTARHHSRLPPVDALQNSSIRFLESTWQGMMSGDEEPPECLDLPRFTRSRV